MSGESVRDLAQDLAAMLGTSASEVLGYIDSGDLMLVEGEPPPGFRPVFSSPTGRKVFASSQVRYRFQEYSDKLALLRTERASGRDNFFYVLDALRARTILHSIPLSSRICTRDKSTVTPHSFDTTWAPTSISAAIWGWRSIIL